MHFEEPTQFERSLCKGESQLVQWPFNEFYMNFYSLEAEYAQVFI